MTDLIDITEGRSPLIVTMPHTGTEIPPEIEARLVSPWLARLDADWWIDKLYSFAGALDATIIRTRISRTVIDANRDPSGASLYPGMATTELCPTVTFDGEPLYRPGSEVSPAEIEERKRRWFAPYHQEIARAIERLRASHPKVVLYDAHSIRSRVPRLFDSVLPHFNIGTNSGASCSAALSGAVQTLCDNSAFSWVVNGRFKGGWTTRHYGRPEDGTHAIQMELACRGYMKEPEEDPSERNWPPPYREADAAALRSVLARILEACLGFARETKERS